MRKGAPSPWAARGRGLGSVAALLTGGALLLGILAGCSTSASQGTSPRASVSSPAAGGSGTQGVAQRNKMTPNAPAIVRAPAVQPYQGGPRLAVDEAAYDFGKVKLEDWVEAVYHVKNVGDAPLTIRGEPAVRTVVGC